MSEGKKYQIKYSGDGVPSTKVKGEYDKILQEIADDFEIDIEVITCHGNPGFVPPELDFDKFYIFAQLAPETFKTKKSNFTEIDTGEVRHAEKKFIDKIREYLDELEGVKKDV